MKGAAARLAVAAAVIAILTPPAAILHLILTRGVNVPFQDEWHLVPFVLKAHAGYVSFADVWAQHNEHRIASVRLIILLLQPFSRFNVVSYMLAGFLMAAGALALFWRALQLTVGQVHSKAVLWLLLPVSLLVFSAVQYETWLFSLPALQWHVGTLCAALTVWSFARWPASWRALMVGGASAAASMLAVVSGFALWGASVLAMLVPRPIVRARLWRVGAVGAAVAMVLLLVYFAGFEQPSYHPSPILALLMPLAVGKFVAAYVGAPFALHTGPVGCGIVGALAVVSSAAVVVLAVRSPGPTRLLAAPWVGLWAYALAVALATAIGRVRLSLGFALSRHYPGGAALLWIAAFVLAWLVCSERIPRLTVASRRIAGAAVAAITVMLTLGYLGAYRFAMIELDARQRDLDNAYRAVLAFESAPDASLQILYPPNPALVREFSAQLKEAGLGPFSAPTPRRSLGPLQEAGSSDRAFDFVGFLDVAACDSLTGWAMNRNAPDRHVAVDLYGDDRMLATVEATWNRPDVRAAGFGTGRYGFHAAVPAELRDGRPHVIRARIAGRTWELTGSPKTIRCGTAAVPR